MNIDKESIHNRERVILAVYTVYTIVMVIAAFSFKWGSWIIPVIIGGLALSIIFHYTGYKTYILRATITTLFMWMNFTIYLLNIQDDTSFTASLATMAALIILIAIYCIPKLTYIGVFVYTALLLYHFLVVKDLSIRFNSMALQDIIRIVSVYVVSLVTYELIKKQEESNATMLANLEMIMEAERSKDDFMANMSHEIRTPINTVCGLSEMILRENLSEEVRNGIYDIQTAGRHLLSLVSDILDFSELSSGKMDIIPDTYNITSTVNDILNMAVAKAEGKNIEIIVDCDPSIPRGLVGDEQKIRRALLNVLDNAIKFTEEGGVLLSFSFREESYGGNLCVTIQDTGIGMKEDVLETLFNRFSQIDTRRNRKASGIGLGLSITKVIVNRMGGFISVNSKFGEGTTVQMVFPQQVSDLRPLTSVDKPEESRTLLYLDADKYHYTLVRDGYARMIGRLAGSLNIPYQHAKSLAEFKRRFEREKFDYVFVAWKEYCEAKQYFEDLSMSTNVVLILERDHKESIEGSRLLCVYKPIYSLTISSVLNGQYADYIGRNSERGIRFTAPDAKVLVVDDNIMNLKVIEGLLRPYNFKIYTAESGKEALEKIESEHFDLIFMDHMMPEMDGIETFHRIRQKPGSYYESVPIIALTANAIGGAREMFLQEGFSDYVSKPIELSALERALSRFIPDSKKLMINQGSLTASENVTAVNTSDIPSHTEPVENATHESDLTIEGIDTKLGIHYCGESLNDYLEVVRTYVKIGWTKKDDIRKSFEEADWKNYTILVHAVKSTSLGIGAVKLSEMAKELEDAGKNEDAGYIAAHNSDMLEEYERVLCAASASKIVFPDDKDDKEERDLDNLLEISREELIEHVTHLVESLDNFDEEGSKDVMNALSEYKYKEEALYSMLSEIRDKLGEFDFMGASEKAAGLLEDIK